MPSLVSATTVVSNETMAQEPATSKLQKKVDLGRGRLTVSNAEEDDLHQGFLKECRKICDPVIRTFVDCSKREGFLVVFKCRSELRMMNDCLKPLSANERYYEWKAEKLGITVAEAEATSQKK